jgi:hypothetical protein
MQLRGWMLLRQSIVLLLLLLLLLLSWRSCAGARRLLAPLVSAALRYITARLRLY